MDRLLTVEDLAVTYTGSDDRVDALRGVSFSVRKGECLGILGESGSGKTTLALALLGLLDRSVELSGSIRFEHMDLLRMGEDEWNQYRWNRIALVFQNNLDALNPVLPLRTQIAESMVRHFHWSAGKAGMEADSLIEQVGLDRSWGDRFPHELSGGMLQRVFIAMALACSPDLLIADEPGSSLDPATKREVIRLLEELCRNRGCSLILISHDVSLIQSLADRTLVLYGGTILEEGPTEKILAEPDHPYTRGFMASSPALRPYRDLWGIRGEGSVPASIGCVYASRCTQSLAGCFRYRPVPVPLCGGRIVSCHRGGAIRVLEARNLWKRFRTRKGETVAVRGVDLEIRAGEVVALVGSSGSGKSTLAKLLAGVLSPDAGEVYFDGEPVIGNSATRRPAGIQIVFQDPYASVDEQLTVEEAVGEPLWIRKSFATEEIRRKVKDALWSVSLPVGESFLGRRCFTLSGGQRQRVSIARALVMEPRVLIADEICSMLDPSTQANILRMLKGLQNERGFAMLFITHDLAMARKIADRLLVMEEGEYSSASLDTCRPVA
ncbi:MAG: ABC transporter ATP-binding protein [Spirochaetales bacterium]